MRRKIRSKWNITVAGGQLATVILLPTDSKPIHVWIKTYKWSFIGNRHSKSVLNITIRLNPEVTLQRRGLYWRTKFGIQKIKLNILDNKSATMLPCTLCV